MNYLHLNPSSTSLIAALATTTVIFASIFELVLSVAEMVLIIVHNNYALPS